jgi:hypothetical protein
VYINRPDNKPTGKAEYLITKHAAWPLTDLEAERAMSLNGISVVCVKHNQTFEVASVMYDKYRFDKFADKKDKRPTRWLMLQTSVLKKLVS